MAPRRRVVGGPALGLVLIALQCASQAAQASTSCKALSYSGWTPGMGALKGPSPENRCAPVFRPRRPSAEQTGLEVTDMSPKTRAWNTRRSPARPRLPLRPQRRRRAAAPRRRSSWSATSLSTPRPASPCRCTASTGSVRRLAPGSLPAREHLKAPGTPLATASLEGQGQRAARLPACLPGGILIARLCGCISSPQAEPRGRRPPEQASTTA